MSAIPRIALVSVASAATVGLIVPITVAPPASAAPCNQTASAIEPDTAAAPSAGGPTTALPWPFDHLPIGRKPRFADEHAPLPKLGPLRFDFLHPDSRHSAPLQDQAAVIPAPNPPGTGNQQPPNVSQRGPNAATAQPPAAQAPAAAVAAPTTSLVGWVNGPSSPNHTLRRFGISGSDLGVIWDNGDPNNDQVLIAFGDTFGHCRVRGQQWRRNTMFRSDDRVLSHGIDVPYGIFLDKYSGSPEDRLFFSKQIIDSLNLAPTEASVIPTAGISVGATQYVNFMSVKQWGSPGQWTTNFSALATSTDNGQYWVVNPATIRAAAANSVARVPYVPGNQNFQQGAFMRPGDGYVYSFGTPSGRGGSAFMARVPEEFVQDLTKYEYWSSSGGGSWVLNNPSAATAVIPAPVSEMSGQYNDYLKKYIVLYCDGSNDVVMRTAPAPEGPWSPAQTLVKSTEIPGGIYAPYIHPWSSGKDLYFNLSLWSAYSVMSMHTVLP